MKILVAVKRVIDFKASIRVKADGSGVDTTNIKMSMNPFDEIAVEEAIRLKEKGVATEIIVVSIGTEASLETLRTALAMGADQAILIKTETLVAPLVAAKILKELVAQHSPNLIILGKQAIDTDNNQVGQMLAALLQWPQGTFISELEVVKDGIRVVREIDGGLETLLLRLPAVVTTDLRLNEPRYISLPNIMLAKRKLIQTISADTLSVDLTSRQKILQMKTSDQKRSLLRVENVKELVKCLKQDAQVI